MRRSGPIQGTRENLELGEPLSARYQKGQTWQRDFTNGSVVVDPANLTASINLH